MSFLGIEENFLLFSVALFLVAFCVGVMIEEASAQYWPYYYPYYGYYLGKRQAGFGPSAAGGAGGAANGFGGFGQGGQGAGAGGFRGPQQFFGH